MLGRAAPQGSMRGYVVKGKARVTSDNSKTMPYRQQVGMDGTESAGGCRPQ